MPVAVAPKVPTVMNNAAPVAPKQTAQPAATPKPAAPAPQQQLVKSKLNKHILVR